MQTKGPKTIHESDLSQASWHRTVMAYCSSITKRNAFCAVTIAVTLTLVIISISSGYHVNVQTGIKRLVGKETADLSDLTLPEVRRFSNGRVAVRSSRYGVSREQLARLSTAELELLYENVALETTADCSTNRRFGRRGKDGWDVCLVGPFTPQEPCFSFSFGTSGIWEFHDEVAVNFSCQMLVFNPTMSQDSHLRSNKVHAIRDGLNSKNSYLSFLKRFEAENFKVDILKIDVDSSEWAVLETAVSDGSLNNVKQLMLRTRINQEETSQNYQRYIGVLRALHDLGFRQWRHNWDTAGSYSSRFNKNHVVACCHKLYYVNINFLTSDQPVKNPSGSELVGPLTGMRISRAAGYSHVDNVLKMQVGGMNKKDLEIAYFTNNEQQHITCTNKLRIGDAADGGWDVCFSRDFNIINSKPCVAFSFGINNVWTYDDVLADKFNCKVYMFDPSMKVADHKRKKTSWFFSTGLSSENKVDTNGWKMRTLCKLFEELGYSNSTIDILKIDVDYWEWVSFEQALREGCLRRVKQFMFETHTSEMLGEKSDYGRFIRMWQGLYELGFRTWKWHMNPLSTFYQSAASPGVRRACCYEHYLLNIKFTQL